MTQGAKAALDSAIFSYEELSSSTISTLKILTDDHIKAGVYTLRLKVGFDYGA